MNQHYWCQPTSLVSIHVVKYNEQFLVFSLFDPSALFNTDYHFLFLETLFICFVNYFTVLFFLLLHTPPKVHPSSLICQCWGAREPSL